MQKIRLFLLAVAVVVMLSVLAVGASVPTVVDVPSGPGYLIGPDDPGGGQGSGGGG